MSTEQTPTNNESLLVEHIPFNLEWAKRGGIMLGRDTSDFTCNFARIIHRSIHTTNDKERYTIVEFFKMSPKKGCVVFVPNNYYTDDIHNSFRMATRAECAAAGVEYIEPPVSAEFQPELRMESERLVEIKNAVLKLSKVEGRNHAKRAINELYDLIGI